MIDELDDAVGALRQCSIGVGAEFGVVLAGGIGAAAMGAALLMGAPIL